MFFLFRISVTGEIATILDKTCWHMLKKGTFPPNFVNKVSVAPLPPNNVATNVFHIQRKNLDDSELNTRLQINIVREKGGLCQHFCLRLYLGINIGLELKMVRPYLEHVEQCWSGQRFKSKLGTVGLIQVNESGRYNRPDDVRNVDLFTIRQLEGLGTICYILEKTRAGDEIQEVINLHRFKATTLQDGKVDELSWTRNESVLSCFVDPPLR